MIVAFLVIFILLFQLHVLWLWLSWASSLFYFSCMYYDCGSPGHLHSFISVACTMIVALLGIFILLFQLHVLWLWLSWSSSFFYFSCMYYDCGSPGHLHYFISVACTMIVALLGIFILLFQLHVLCLWLSLASSFFYFSCMYYDWGFPGHLHSFISVACTRIVALLGIFILLFQLHVLGLWLSWASSFFYFSCMYYDCGSPGHLHSFISVACTMIVALLDIFIILFQLHVLWWLLSWTSSFFYFSCMYYDGGSPGHLHSFISVACTMIVAFLGIFILLFQLHVLGLWLSWASSFFYFSCMY